MEQTKRRKYNQRKRGISEKGMNSGSGGKSDNGYDRRNGKYKTSLQHKSERNVYLHRSLHHPPKYGYHDSRQMANVRLENEHFPILLCEKDTG